MANNGYTDNGMQCFKHLRPKSEGEGVRPKSEGEGVRPKSEGEGVRPQVWNTVASFPGPREGGENGLVSTVCACAKLSVTVTCIHKGEGANDVFVVTWSSV